MDATNFLRWLHDSGKALGGSDIGAIIGVNHFANSASVWDTIMEQVPRGSDNAHILRGRYLEPAAADRYATDTNSTLVSCPTFYDPDHGFFRYSPDRVITQAERVPRDGRGILEIKVPTSRNWSETRLHGVDPSYYAQLQWYMGGARKKWGAFAIFNADTWQLFHHQVEFDEHYYRTLYDAGIAFWRDHVLARVRPQFSDTDSEPVNTPRVGGEAREVNDSQWLLRLSTLKEVYERKQLAEREYDNICEDIKQRIAALGPDVDVITTPLAARVPVTVRWQNTPQQRFDLERFRREHPDLAAQFVRTVETRPFRVNFGRES